MYNACMRNFFCNRCWDTGKVGWILHRVCPKCDGDPHGTWIKTHPRPPPPMPQPPPKQTIDIRIVN